MRKTLRDHTQKTQTQSQPVKIPVDIETKIIENTIKESKSEGMATFLKMVIENTGRVRYISKDLKQ
ncbi:MAG TPA: hypothetical protein VD815_02200 [Candidatus Saccharimonadales bacterium]|nr:hypothetical protein [Candidatus Saccharimonadales bacterium]